MTNRPERKIFSWLVACLLLTGALLEGCNSESAPDSDGIIVTIDGQELDPEGYPENFIDVVGAYCDLAEYQRSTVSTQNPPTQLTEEFEITKVVSLVKASVNINGVDRIDEADLSSGLKQFLLQNDLSEMLESLHFSDKAVEISISFTMRTSGDYTESFSAKYQLAGETLSCETLETSEVRKKR